MLSKTTQSEPKLKFGSLIDKTGIIYDLKLQYEKRDNLLWIENTCILNADILWQMYRYPKIGTFVSSEEKWICLFTETFAD